jgi:amino acid transporter
MLYDIIRSQWFWIPSLVFILYAILVYIQWSKSKKEQIYSLNHIRESISTGITVIGIFVIALASLVIWLHQSYGTGQLEEITPLIVVIIYFSIALVIGLYLIFYSSTHLSSDDTFKASFRKNHLFIIAYGYSGVLILIGLIILFFYFAFSFDIDKIEDHISGND